MKNGFLEPRRQAFDIRVEFVDAADRRQKQHKFVAANPRQQVGGADLIGDAAGDLHQQAVAHRMSVIIVDVLEIIDVDEGQREFRLGAIALDQVLDAFFQQGRDLGRPVRSSK